MLRVFPLVRTGGTAAALLTLLATQGCLTYSSYQSAHIVERGKPHATLGVSRSSILGEDSDEGTWWTVDGDIRFGIAKRIDGSARLSIFHNVPEEWGGAHFSMDIRGGIIEDHLAVTIPVSVAVGDFHFASLRILPGVIGTIPLGDRAEINGAISAHMYVRVPELLAVGYNLGLGIKSSSGEWTVRPEVGWLQFTGMNADLTYFQYGIGVEHNFIAVKENDDSLTER